MLASLFGKRRGLCGKCNAKRNKSTDNLWVFFIVYINNLMPYEKMSLLKVG